MSSLAAVQEWDETDTVAVTRVVGRNGKTYRIRPSAPQAMVAIVFDRRVEALHRFVVRPTEWGFNLGGRWFAGVVSRDEHHISRIRNGSRAVPGWAWKLLNAAAALAEIAGREAARELLEGGVAPVSDVRRFREIIGADADDLLARGTGRTIRTVRQHGQPAAPTPVWAGRVYACLTRLAEVAGRPAVMYGLMDETAEGVVDPSRVHRLGLRA